MKAGFPDIHFGGFAASRGWSELLPGNCYGAHPAWHGPRGCGAEHAGRVALIPWLLFNRHLWAARVEFLPAGVRHMNLLVPRAESTDEAPDGWYVRLKFSEDLDVEGLEAIPINDESAPSPEGFEVLALGALPPVVIEGSGKRRGRRAAMSMAMLIVSGGLCLAADLMLGASAEQERAFERYTAEAGALRSQQRELRSELDIHQGFGLSAMRAGLLLMDAVWLDAQVEVRGQEVRWLDPSPLGGEPDGLQCDEPDKESEGSGWRNCRWDEEGS